MTEDQVLEIVARIKDAYPRQVVGLGTLAVYSQMLGDLPYAAANNAVRDLLASSRFFPTIAEIRERVVALRLDAPAPEQAWGEVVTAFGYPGRTRTPKWPHPLIGKAVDCLGWQEMCDSDNHESTRARFIEAYASISRRQMHEAQVEGVLPPFEERKRLACEPGEPTFMAKLLNLGDGHEGGPRGK